MNQTSEHPHDFAPVEGFSLRQELSSEAADLGLKPADMANLKSITAVIDEFAEGDETLVSASLATLSGVLPEELRRYHKLRGAARAHAKETYEKINTYVESKHDASYAALAERMKAINYLDPSEYKSKTYFITAMLEKLETSMPDDPETVSALEEYFKYSWYLVLTNNRAVYSLSKRMAGTLDSYGLPIEEDDVFQAGLVGAYKLALRHDGEKGTFRTYIYNYLGDDIVRELLREGDISRKDVKYILAAQHMCTGFLRANKIELTAEDKAFMIALFYFRKTRQVDFEDNDAEQACQEFKTMFAQGRSYMSQPEHFKTELKKSQIRSTVHRFFDRLDSLNNFRATVSLDRENLVNYTDESGGVETFLADLHEVGSSGVPRPVEDEVEKRELRANIFGILEDIQGGFDLTPRNIEIYKLLHGLTDGQSRTLDATAKIFQLTRERIRQIDAHITRVAGRAYGRKYHHDGVNIDLNS